MSEKASAAGASSDLFGVIVSLTELVGEGLGFWLFGESSLSLLWSESSDAS